MQIGTIYFDEWVYNPTQQLPEHPTPALIDVGDKAAMDSRQYLFNCGITVCNPHKMGLGERSVTV